MKRKMKKKRMKKRKKKKRGQAGIQIVFCQDGSVACPRLTCSFFARRLKKVASDRDVQTEYEY